MMSSITATATASGFYEERKKRRATGAPRDVTVVVSERCFRREKFGMLEVVMDINIFTK